MYVRSRKQQYVHIRYIILNMSPLVVSLMVLCFVFRKYIITLVHLKPFYQSKFTLTSDNDCLYTIKSRVVLMKIMMYELRGVLSPTLYAYHSLQNIYTTMFDTLTPYSHIHLKLYLRGQNTYIIT